MYSLCRVIRSHGRQRIDPGVSESVTRPFQRQNLCVMDDSVDHHGSDCLIAEYVTPPIWGWHLFVSVETRSSLGLQHVFAFQPSSSCERSILGAALTVQV
jgi:hypothetical protein